MPPTPRSTDALPERSLTPQDPLPTVAIRSAGHHPFVYKKMVAGAVGMPRPRDGDLVRVVDRDGMPIGFGLWNSKSQIALRIINHGQEAPGVDHWRAKLAAAAALRKGPLRLDEQTDAYRVIHGEADGLSGLIVDKFADTLSVEVFSLGMYQRIGPILDLLREPTATKHARVHVDDRIALAEDFPGRPVTTPDAPPKVTIKENGARFRVNFEGGHKTGFFCDQRENRKKITDFTPGRTVLDLCCYSGGFTVNALMNGKAREATAVDLDEKAIATAKENANLNQLKPTLVHADAFGYCRQMGVNGREYGVVVLDPPKLIPGRLDISAGKRKYFDLNVLAMKLVEEDGLLLTCSCSGLMGAEEFLILLRAAARKAGRSARILAVTGASPDHPVGIDALEGSYLKAVWLWMGERRATSSIEADFEEPGSE